MMQEVFFIISQEFGVYQYKDFLHPGQAYFAKCGAFFCKEYVSLFTKVLFKIKERVKKNLNIKKGFKFIFFLLVRVNKEDMFQLKNRFVFLKNTH